MKVTYNEDRYLPSLGLVVKAGEEVEVPDDPFATSPAPAAVVSTKKQTKNEGVVNSDGDSAQ